MVGLVSRWGWGVGLVYGSRGFRMGLEVVGMIGRIWVRGM